MQRRTRLEPQVERMEQKTLLSNALPRIPVLTHHTVSDTLRSIDRAAGTFAKTKNQDAFVASLGPISGRLPFGRRDLLPTWQADVSIYNPAIRGSGLQMVQQLKKDLGKYIQAGVSSGEFRFR